MEPIYRDRRDAGEKLAVALAHYRHTPGLVVLALPRGGLPVAAPVARLLEAPLDVFVVRKIGFPGQEEFAMGAVASGGVTIVDRVVAERLPKEAFQAALQRALRELDEREHRYRGTRPPLEIGGRTVVLIDDGLATGASMRAAVEAVRRREPARLVVAVPIAAAETCERIAAEVDEIICAATPERFGAVGAWYEDFSQTSDDEVRAILGIEAGPEPTRDVARTGSPSADG